MLPFNFQRALESCSVEDGDRNGRRMALSPPLDHWLPGFNFNVEEWDAKGQTYETLAVCRSLALAHAAFAAAIARSPPAAS